MSIEAMTWAMKLSRDVLADASARHVLLCLANYAGPEGKHAFPSASTLAQQTGLSERTVRYKLDLLEKLGLIVLGKQAIAAVHIDRHDRRPVVYDLQIERGADVAPRIKRGANGVTGCNSQQNGVQTTTERGAATAPNTSINHQVTEEQQREGDVPDAELARQNAAALEPRSDRRFAMFAEWEPDAAQLKAQLTIAGLGQLSVPDDALRAFKGFFVAKQSMTETAGGWCYRLVAWLKRERTKAAARGAEPDFNDLSWANDLGDL